MSLNFEFIHLESSKLQFLVNYLLLRHIDDVIEASNLKINDIFKKNVKIYHITKFEPSTVKRTKVIMPL